MSTLFIVLHLLTGHGHHRHWRDYRMHEATTQTMLCNDRAHHMRDVAPNRRGAKLEIFCRAEPDRV